MNAPRVDFYLLSDADPRARARYACRLAEKAFEQKLTVHVHCGDEAEAQSLDQLLWTFRDKAFLPHGRAGSDEPIEVGAAEPTGAARQVLINLAPEVPEWYERFERVVEVVADGEGSKHASRARFRHYRNRGCTLNTHEIAPR